MAKLFDKYWYKDEPSVRAAFLCHVRDNDLTQGGQIRRGEVVAGKCGYAIAEADVPGFSGRIVRFEANRQCQWQDHILACMALDGLPLGPVPRGPVGGLRHKHFVVAELATRELLEEARASGLPAIETGDGRAYGNLEVAHVPQRQKRYRRATLL